jgi:hypothetical protein
MHPFKCGPNEEGCIRSCCESGLLIGGGNSPDCWDERKREKQKPATKNSSGFFESVHSVEDCLSTRIGKKTDKINVSKISVFSIRVYKKS